ncbi:hypothetical protein NPIL_37581 [Nephila pilipes]|uniref:Uncharacterized protein n=1 Tax=Nephila pilipes TaxID=299642 RepID=A0A8X6Q0I9_NEPPI|nr:hypothetical protein NPIL_37581 [Nephila pilipes]
MPFSLCFLCLTAVDGLSRTRFGSSPLSLPQELCREAFSLDCLLACLVVSSPEESSSSPGPPSLSLPFGRLCPGLPLLAVLSLILTSSSLLKDFVYEDCSDPLTKFAF